MLTVLFGMFFWQWNVNSVRELTLHSSIEWILQFSITEPWNLVLLSGRIKFFFFFFGPTSCELFFFFFVIFFFFWTERSIRGCVCDCDLVHCKCLWSCCVLGDPTWELWRFPFTWALSPGLQLKSASNRRDDYLPSLNLSSVRTSVSMKNASPIPFISCECRVGGGRLAAVRPNGSGTLLGETRPPVFLRRAVHLLRRDKTWKTASASSVRGTWRHWCSVVGYSPKRHFFVSKIAVSKAGACRPKLSGSKRKPEICHKGHASSNFFQWCQEKQTLRLFHPCFLLFHFPSLFLIGHFCQLVSKSKNLSIAATANCVSAKQRAQQSVWR